MHSQSPLLTLASLTPLTETPDWLTLLGNVTDSVGGSLVSGSLVGGSLVGGSLVGGSLVGGSLVGGSLVGGSLVGDG